MLKTWNVICEGRHIGTVQEENEVLARCAALSKFGVSEEEFAEMESHERSFSIPPWADFDVVLA
ncbi:hypothetical protein [Dechloromonas denitrificans]|uniref:hypothetical protein n=1 Tax=Dechloromonas denitrificans TaxID=281362 RepID=UPI001CF87A2B|nr:hypothetical protein [Dechloromonas denitrificans]UCV01838.1 hypothetical protein KI611_12000 [Dechloromonas denitrificans]